MVTKKYNIFPNSISGIFQPINILINSGNDSKMKLEQE